MKFLIAFQIFLAFQANVPPDDLENAKAIAYSAKDVIVYSAKSCKEVIELPEDNGNPLDRLYLPILPPLTPTPTPIPIIDPDHITEVDP